MALDVIPNLGTRLGITDEAWWDLHPESRAVIRGCCLRKAAWTAHGAKVAARPRDGRDHPVTPYRCPFVLDGEPHFHVGRSPNMRTLAAIARTIRDLHHDRPPDRPRSPSDVPGEVRGPASVHRPT